MNEARPPFLLAVDEDVGLLIDLLQVEVAPIEEHLHMRLGEPVAGDGHIVPEGAPHRRHRLV